MSGASVSSNGNIGQRSRPPSDEDRRSPVLVAHAERGGPKSIAGTDALQFSPPSVVER
jgi:hypothetical protein